MKSCHLFYQLSTGNLLVIYLWLGLFPFVTPGNFRSYASHLQFHPGILFPIQHSSSNLLVTAQITRPWLLWLVGRFGVCKVHMLRHVICSLNFSRQSITRHVISSSWALLTSIPSGRAFKESGPSAVTQRMEPSELMDLTLHTTSLQFSLAC